MKVLLAQDDTNPDKYDYTQTPLLIPAFWGHERVVKMLLRRDDVNCDREDEHCLTLLFVYSRGSGAQGSGQILLLGGDDVKPGQVRSRHNANPLCCFE